jgi:hypothetical protein
MGTAGSLRAHDALRMQERYTFRVRLAAVLGMSLATGCSSPDVSATGDAGVSDGGELSCLTCADVTTDVSLVVRVGGLLQICANPDGCHGAGAGNLAISGGTDFSSLIDVRSWEVPSLYRVKPGDPAQSYVYMKLACEGGIEGGCMPPGGSLGPAQVQVFHDWIEAGAPTQ